MHYTSREHDGRGDYNRERNRDRDRRGNRERRRENPKWWILFERKQLESTGFHFGIAAKKGQINGDAESNSWDSRDAAEDEASRLSQDNPDTLFLVVEACSAFLAKSTVKVETRRF